VLGNVVMILKAIVVGVVRLTVVEHWVVRFTVVGGDVVVLAIVVVDWFVVVRIVAVLWLVVGDVSEVMMLVLNIVLVVGGVNWQVLVVNLLMLGVVGDHVRVIMVFEVLMTVLTGSRFVMVISIVVNGLLRLLLFLLLGGLRLSGSRWLGGGSSSFVVLVIDGVAAFRERR